MKTRLTRRVVATRNGQNAPRFKRLLSSSAIAFGMAMIPMHAAHAVDDLALPTGEQVVGGTASFDRPSDGVLNVNQNTDRVVINWDSFNIGEHATTEFFQPGANALAVNRVTGKGSDPTQILGTLKANGQVMVLDRNGVLFGTNAVIDVGGIVASTGDVDTDAVMRGDRTLELNNFGDAQIVNNGTVNVSDAGLAAFVAPTVINNGIIKAKLGKVALAAGGNHATVDLYGDGLVELALDSDKTKVLAQNSGVIDAEGGTVAMTASAAKEVVDDVINMDGVVKVSSVEVKGGKIILSGGKSGKVNISGKLDASGKNGGGEIDVSGQNVNVFDAATLKADAIDTGNGGDIKVVAQDHTDFRGTIYARGGKESGNGGLAEVSGHGSLGFSGLANLGAENGNIGTLLLDPTFAVIYNGLINTNVGSGYVIGAANLANSMQFANVIVQADNFIDVGTKKTAYTGLGAVVNTALNLLPDGDIDLSTYYYVDGTFPFIHTGTTAGSLQLTSNIVNFNRDLTMGNGSVNVTAPTVNLDARIYDADGVTELGDARLNSSTATVNVISDAARIQQGIELGASGATVNVNAGTYNENISINKALTLKGANAGTAGNAARVAESVIQNASSTGQSAITVTGNDVTINGFKIVGDGATTADDAAIESQNANNLSIKNNLITNASFGIYAWGGNVTTGNIKNNYVRGADSQAIHTRDNQYFNITNNKIDTSAVGITTENFSAGRGDGLATKIEGNDISASKIGIRNNLSYGTQTGFLIKNNTITAENSAEARRWTGIDVISQQDGVSTLFQNNHIDGSAVNATRQTAGFELTNMTNASRATIDGGDISNVDVGIWATDGSFYTGAMNDLLIKNMTFSNIGQGDILVEDTQDLTVPAGTGVNATGATVTIGAGNTFSGGYDVALAGSNAKVLLDAGFDGVSKVLVKAAGSSHYVPVAPATSNLTTDNAKIQNGIDIAALGGQVDVEAGTFTENVNIARSVNLQSIAGRAATIINGISNVGALGTIVIGNNANNITIGNVNHGFTINGIDNGLPGIENSGIYLQGNHDAVTIRGNEVVAQGDEALTTEYSLVNSNMVIDNNIFSGKTFIGVVAGAGDQFVDPNVARQLVALNNGLTDITFTNNQITGDSGEQHLVAIESVGGTINNNTFSGTTTGADLRVRGDETVYNNTITGSSSDRGIWISGTGTDVHDNTIHGAQTGVYVASGSTDAKVNVNTIYNIGGDGVKLDGSVGTTVDGNYIGYTDAGITSAGNNNVQGYSIYNNEATGTVAITNNQIIDGAQAGILTQWGTGTLLVDGNHVTSVAGNGLQIEGSTLTQTISNNVIKDAGAEGLHIWNTSGTQVSLNDIDGTTTDGIYAEGNQTLTLQTNTVKNTTGYGIRVIGGAYGGPTIDGNIVNDTGNDGIHVNDVVLLTGSTKISNNQVGLLGGADNINGDGTEVANADGAQITGNQVSETGNGWDNDNGIVVRSSKNVTVGGAGLDRNTITNTGGDGIKLVSTDHATVDNNSTDGDQRIGIYTEGATNTTIENNIIKHASQDPSTSVYGAIFTNGGSDFTITGNDIDDSGSKGILVWNAGGTNLIETNQMDDTYGDAIYALNTSKLTVNDNKIGKDGGNIGGSGIYLDGETSAQVTDNKIANAAWDGVKVVGGGANNIEHNNINKTQRIGIYAENTNGITINNNTLKNTDLDPSTSIYGAIYTTGGNDISITGNDIDDAHANGIYVLNAGGTNLIKKNQIDGTSGDGINVDTASKLTINGNQIGKNGGNVAGDGIHVAAADGIKLINNELKRVGANGISVLNSDKANIDNNTVKDAALTGISLENSAKSDITRNTVNGGKNGIAIDGGEDDLILGNTITGQKKDGIHIKHVDGKADNAPVIISLNDIHGQGDDGIEVDNSRYVGILGNAINDVGGDGISINKGREIEIAGNDVGFRKGRIGGDGIAISNSARMLVEQNRIRKTDGDAISLNNDHDMIVAQNRINNILSKGIAVEGSDSIRVTRNRIGQNASIGGDGILVDNSTNIQVDRNRINDVSSNGLEISASDNVEVLRNLIENSGAAGLFVSGPNNGSVVLRRNQITSLPGNIAALFESGIIDLTALGDDANTFAGGAVGIRFSPYFEGNTLGGGEPPVLIPHYAPLSLVNNTIGESVFELQTSHYVELANGAFFAPGNPTVIDGTHATYDGFRPDTVTFLTSTQYNDLESKIFHYNDNPSLGLFFFGSTFGINQEDIFDTVGGYSAGSRGLSITIRGLPRLPGQGGGNSIFNLANIAPAAGGTQNVADIEPAAGGNDDNNVANIEPAAGGQANEETSCWADAAAGAAGGATVTYSFGGDSESDLNAAAGCGQGSI